MHKFDTKFVIPSGSFQSSYYVTANEYISDRMKRRIDNSTCSMMENGLYRFYESYAEYRRHLRSRKLQNAGKDEVQALNFSDLHSPLMFCSYVIALATLFFLLETVFKWEFRSH